MTHAFAVLNGCTIANWLMIAPSLPEAADRPWHVERYRVGKCSPGMMNVVVFGPKLRKNPARQKRKSIAEDPADLVKSELDWLSVTSGGTARGSTKPITITVSTGRTSDVWVQ